MILANALKEIREPTLKKITAAFEDHRSQRDPHAQTQFQASKMFAMLMVGQVSRSLILLHETSLRNLHTLISYFHPFVPWF